MGDAESPPSRSDEALLTERVADLLVQTVDDARSVYAEAYRERGLTELQWLVLRRLRAADDAPTLGGLGEWLGTEPSTITALVDRLETRGLVTRENDPADRRRRRLHLTPAATTVLAEIDAAAAPNSPCRRLSTTKLAQLEGLLELMQRPAGR